jgi:hypothetical protein
MGEMPVDGEGLGDAKRVHHHEAQAVDEAVALVAVPCKVGEGGPLLVRRRPVDARELLAVELLPIATAASWSTFAWVRVMASATTWFVVSRRRGSS